MALLVCSLRLEYYTIRVALYLWTLRSLRDCYAFLFLSLSLSLSLSLPLSLSFSVNLENGISLLKIFRKVDVCEIHEKHILKNHFFSFQLTLH